MGVYELLAVLGFLTWGLLISIVGYVEAAFMWQKFDDMQAANIPMTQIHGYKFLALGFIVGVGAWISGLALGDSCAELLGFFDNYNVKKEGREKDADEDDEAGTALTYDLSHTTSSPPSTPTSSYQSLPSDPSSSDSYSLVTEERQE